MIEKIRAKGQLAFTLLEILIVVAIIAFLSVAFLPNILEAPKKSRDAVRIKTVGDIQTGLEAYYAEKGKFPAEDSAVDNCFTDAVATKLGMKSTKDSQKLYTCGALSAGNEYFYVTDTNGTFYLVGSVLELTSSANVYAGTSSWGVVSKAAGEALLAGATLQKGFISVGPK